MDGVETHGVILQSVGGGGGIIDGVFMGSLRAMATLGTSSYNGCDLGAIHIHMDIRSKQSTKRIQGDISLELSAVI